MHPLNPRTVGQHVLTAAVECHKKNETPVDHPNKLALSKATRAKVLVITNILRAKLDFNQVIKGPSMSNFIIQNLRMLFTECLLNFDVRESIIESKDFGKFKKPSNVIYLDEFHAS